MTKCDVLGTQCSSVITQSRLNTSGCRSVLATTETIVDDVLYTSVGGLFGSTLCPHRRRILRHCVQDPRQLSVVHEQLSQPNSLRVPVGAVSQELPTPAVLSTVWLVPVGPDWSGGAGGKGRPRQQHRSGAGDRQRPPSTATNGTADDVQVPEAG